MGLGQSSKAPVTDDTDEGEYLTFLLLVSLLLWLKSVEGKQGRCWKKEEVEQDSPAFTALSQGVQGVFCSLINGLSYSYIITCQN